MKQELIELKTVDSLRRQSAAWRKDGQRIALVPTMGALHAGHLSLVALARQQADKVVASIFVNPTQFGANEDLDAYPRTIDSDLRQLAASSADSVFLPGVTEVYPTGFATSISVKGISSGLCGGDRPGHFDGVALVVAKLLLICQPDVAMFGEKDYQQLLVIKRMVRDLNIPVEIVGAPIIREADGLALSSRNAYLSPQERQTAPLLQRSLQQAAKRLIEGDHIYRVLQAATESLSDGGFEVDYMELRDSESLKPLTALKDQPARLLAAARLGRTRLIDNIAIMR